MAHYALINAENIVVQVIAGVDETITQIDQDGSKVGGSAEAWEKFYENLPWFAGLTCKRTSLSNQIRKQFASIGYSYDASADIFIKPQPYPSWQLDENYDWQPPKPRPLSGDWIWMESKLDWVGLDS